MRFHDLLKKIPSPEEITGSFGEKIAEYFSKTLPGALVLHDILIEGAEGYTSQIDLILVGGRGIYVVEVKAFEGAKIYGDVKKSKWSYYKGGQKYEIYSPVRQNSKHIEYLKKLLKDFGDLPFFSVVLMFSEDFKVSGEFDGRTVICNTLPSMDRGMTYLAERNPLILDEEKKQEIFTYIKNNQIAGKEARREHKSNVREYKNTLEEMKQQKICPYCENELVLRNGKNGEFYGCKGFPKCRYTLNK